MKIFFSWSGDLSESLADTFRVWLPNILPSAEIYFTPKTKKGSPWFIEMNSELKATDVGILFLTRSNIESPWVTYEAGAITNSPKESRVCPLLFGLEPEDLPAPLQHFQTTKFEKEDFHVLLKTINSSSSKHQRAREGVDKDFESHWPKLYQDFQGLLESARAEEAAVVLQKDREVANKIRERHLQRFAGTWAGQAEQQTANPRAASHYNASLKITDSLDGNVMKLYRDDEEFRFEEVLGFEALIADSEALMVKFVNLRSDRRQFGSALLRMSGDGKRLEGRFIAFGIMSELPVSGTIELSRSD